MVRLFLFMVSLIPIFGPALSLDSLYQLATADSGYDKYLVLDSGQNYEGGIVALPGLKTGINGFGAIIDLGAGNIHQFTAMGTGTVLDLKRSVIKNGPDSLSALDYGDSASGALHHLTITDNFNGVSFWRGMGMILKNSIIVNSRLYGIVSEDSSLDALSISYVDCWGNTSGNYMCWFASC